jgi:hypothetical protein
MGYWGWLGKQNRFALIDMITLAPQYSVLGVFTSSRVNTTISNLRKNLSEDDFDLWQVWSTFLLFVRHTIYCMHIFPK